MATRKFYDLTKIRKFIYYLETHYMETFGSFKKFKILMKLSFIDINTLINLSNQVLKDEEREVGAK